MDIIGIVESSAFYFSNILGGAYIVVAFFFTTVKVGRLMGLISVDPENRSPLAEFLSNFD